jgi:hypothetical protein
MWQWHFLNIVHINEPPWRIERSVWSIEAGKGEKSLVFVLFDILTSFRSNESRMRQILIGFPYVRRNSSPWWFAIGWPVGGRGKCHTTIIDLIRGNVLNPFYICVFVASRLVGENERIKTIIRMWISVIPVRMVLKMEFAYIGRVIAIGLEHSIDGQGILR